MALLGASLVLLLLGSRLDAFIEVARNRQGWEDAGRMLNASIDTNINPCDDFQKFACGNWEKTAEYVNGRTRKNAITDTQDGIWAKMIGLYEDPERSGSKIIEQMKLAYGRCMDEREDRVGYLIEKVQQHGGWPMIDWCVELNHDLTDLLILARNEVLISIGASVDITNTEGRHKYILNVGSALLDTSNSRIYKNASAAPEQVAALKDYTHEKIALLQSDYHKAGKSQCAFQPVPYAEAEKLFELEVKLFSARTRSIRVNFNKLAQILPEIDWIRLIASAGSKATEIIAANPEISVDVGYLQNLRKILAEDKKTVVNYIFWRYMRTRFLTKYQLGGEYAKVDEIIPVLSRNQIVNQETNASCSMILSWFSAAPIHATSAMYARNFVSEATKTEIWKMTLGIAAAIKEIVRENPWLTEDTKNEAIAKISQMKLNIIYPDWILNNTALDRYYEDLQWGEHDSYSSILDKIKEFVVKEELNKVGTELDRDEFKYPSHFANGNLEQNKNSMEFPAAMMQAPFFRPDFPKAVNYGAVGFVLAHEYTHTFDNSGKDFNSIGNKVNWWDAQSQQGYKDRTQCLVDQYSKYLIDNTGLLVNGDLTLSENIADIEGIKAAYRAYTNYLKRLPSGREDSIPHMDAFSNEQNFFISYAQQYCSINTDYDKIERQAWDAHAPDGLRITGVLSNMPEFAEAFSCSPQSKMVSKQRCSVF